MLKKLMIAGAAMAGLVATDAALAGAIRCGNYLIEDSTRTAPGKYEILKKCGQPTAKVGNAWVYDRGGSKRVVHFNDSGRVDRISDG